MMATSVRYRVDLRPGLPMLIGLAFASFIFLPIIRAFTGMSQMVYVVPFVFLCSVLLVSARLRAISVSPWVLGYLFIALSFLVWMLLSSFWTISATQVVEDITLIVYLAAILFTSAFLADSLAIRWSFIWLILSG